MSGLLHDKTRLPGTPPLPADTVARVVAMTVPSRPAKLPINRPGDGQARRHLAAINRYLASTTRRPRPFSWTRSADAILDRLAPIPASSV